MKKILFIMTLMMIIIGANGQSIKEYALRSKCDYSIDKDVTVFGIPAIIELGKLKDNTIFSISAELQEPIVEAEILRFIKVLNNKYNIDLVFSKEADGYIYIAKRTAYLFTATKVRNDQYYIMIYLLDIEGNTKNREVVNKDI